MGITEADAVETAVISEDGRTDGQTDGRTDERINLGGAGYYSLQYN
jgi:hypothetical protein